MTRRPKRKRDVSLPPLPWSPLSAPADGDAAARARHDAILRRRKAATCDRREAGMARPVLRRIEVEDPTAEVAETGKRARVGVTRAALPACIARMAPSRREAFEAYARLLEEVSAGGARGPGGDVNAGVARSSPTSGPGVGALMSVDALRRVEEAINPRLALALSAACEGDARRAPRVAVSVGGALRALAADGASLAGALQHCGAATHRRNEIALRDAMFAALGRVAEVLGLEG